MAGLTAQPEVKS